nr:MAG TPA: hypothetical protein [Caudoviricetes sp.]
MLVALYQQFSVIVGCIIFVILERKNLLCK